MSDNCKTVETIACFAEVISWVIDLEKRVQTIEQIDSDRNDDAHARLRKMRQLKERLATEAFNIAFSSDGKIK